MRVFWFHYHKARSKKYGKPQLTIHYKGKCLIADNIECAVPIYGFIRKEQPIFALKGLCANIDIVEGIARVT